jgi:hypothetical protein
MAEEPKKKAPIDYSKVRVLTDSEAEKVDQLVQEVQAMIRRVKRQYELWFYGTENKPPYEMRNDLDRHVRLLRNKMPKRTADQFKLATALAYYQTLAELWDKTQRKLEEGGLAPWTSRSHKSPLEELQEANEKRAEEAREAAQTSKSAYVARVTADADDSEFRKVYNSYVAAQKKLGSGTQADYDKFKATLARQTQSLIDSGKATAVAYRVEIQDGKVSIKAKAEK